MHILKIISGPLIGALIGYFTNYIAVKMLFFPKKEVRIFGKRLPFTPGAIPKGRKRLAKKAGSVIANQLITKEAIVSRMTEPEFENAMVNRIASLFTQSIEKMVANAGYAEAKTAQMKEKMTVSMTASIADSIKDIDFEQLVRDKGIVMIKQKLAGSLIGAFVTDGMLNNFVEPIAASLRDYVETDGRDLVQEQVAIKVEHLFSHSPESLLKRVDIEHEQIQRVIKNKYRTLAEEGVERILNRINVSDIVADAIDAMSIDELEEMVLSVMKKEFDMIINLGAFIGFVLGLLNLVI